MSDFARLELNSEKSVDQIQKELALLRIETDVVEISEEKRRGPRFSQCKRFTVWLLVYNYTRNETDLMLDITEVAKYLLSISDGEVFYYRNEVFEEYDLEDTVFMTLPDLKKYPPLSENQHKRYVISRA